MLASLCLLAAIASAHAYITVAEKGPKDSGLYKYPPNGSYYIPAGQTSGYLNVNQLGCPYLGRYYPASSLRLVVDDDGGYALIDISDDMTSAVVTRTGSVRQQATVDVNFVCHSTNLGSKLEAAEQDGGRPFAPEQAKSKSYGSKHGSKFRHASSISPSPSNSEIGARALPATPQDE